MLSRSVKKWLRRIVIIALIGSGIGYFAFGRDKQVTYVTEKATLRDVREIVDVAGSVEANESVSLRFQSGGKIATIAAKVGDAVEAGTVLGSLDATLAGIEVQKAEASLAAAQAELNLIYAGPANTEQAIYKTDIDDAELALTHAAKSLVDVNRSNERKLEKAEQEVANAKVAIANTEIALANAKNTSGTSSEIADKGLSDIFEDAENDIRSALDTIEQAISTAATIMDDDSSEGRQRRIYLGFKNPQSKITANNSLKYLHSVYNSLADDFTTAQNDWTAKTIAEMIKQTESALLGTKDLMDDVFAVLESSAESTLLTETVIERFKTDVVRERSSLLSNVDNIRSTEQTIDDAVLNITSTGATTTSSVDTAEAALSDAESRLAIAERALAELKVQNTISANNAKKDIELKKLRVRRAEESLAKLIAQPRGVDAAAAQARVQQARATVRQAQKQYDDMFLVSPVNGVVTAVNSKLGENISVSETFAEVMTDELQITANISETDVAKIAKGATVEITFDALPRNLVFSGTVVDIDPAETVIQGVIYYQATVTFEAEDARIKSGMTADLEVLVDKQLDALSVTPGAIQYEGDVPFLYVLENGEKIHREIEVGLEGNDAVEIVSGIEENERVVLYEEEE